MPTPAPKLSLPNITLVLIDTTATELANQAIKDTLQHITPYDVHIWTDAVGYNDFDLEDFVPRFFYRDINSKEDYGKILWHEVPKYINTSHILVIQWDGWVINPQAWTNDFLSFDYIGAVWPWHKTNRVGNGGFSLRSKRIMETLHRVIPYSQEDDHLCRVLRDFQEFQGLHWADETTANKFSREHNWNWNFNPREKAPSFPFGFHDCRNWPRIMGPEQLVLRMEMCERNPYIKKKLEYQELKRFTKYPSLSEMTR